MVKHRSVLRPKRKKTASTPPAGLPAALAILLEAYDCAQKLGRLVWDFAVGAEKKKRDAATFGAESASPRERDSGGMNEDNPGERRALALLQEIYQVLTHQLTDGKDATLPAAQVPQWDARRRELRLGSDVVKSFHQIAGNQEIILAVFEEEGWPSQIDDPLPLKDGLDPKERLHETVKALNKHQKKAHIRFRGDGSGEGIRWEKIP